MRFAKACAVAALTISFALGMATAEAKVFRVNVIADPPTLDPIAQTELVAGRILNNEYEGFTLLTDDGKSVPALAESWEPLTTGNGYRFHLRKNVKFHSGRTFTAKDVKYTLERLLTPGVKAGLAAGYAESIQGSADMKAGKAKELAGIHIVDDNTIDIAFSKPDVLFPIYP